MLIRPPSIQGQIQTTPARPRPGEPCDVLIRYQDKKTGQPITDYELEHEKPMHLVCVSRDLSTFAHLHPTLEDTQFHITVNQATSDPDNADAPSAIPKGGPFLLYTEVKPHNRPLQTNYFDIQAEGAEEPTPLPLDPTMSNGSIRKYFTAEGQPGHEGDAYQVTFSTEKMPGMLHFNFNLQHATGDGKYQGITDLENWLGMPGHGILVSQRGDHAEDKIFQHLHAGHHKDGPDLTFMVHDEMPPPGNYKLWAQFKHHGRVLTFPYVFELKRFPERSYQVNCNDSL